MPNIVLLGDSTLDNASYVSAGEHVLAQLDRVLPAGWRATLLAIDGDVIGGIERQLRRTPEDASHLIISVGGNDALRESGLLSAGARSVAEALERLATVRERFAADYRAMLDTIAARKLPTAICTIYDAAFPDPASRRIASTALAVLNDVITREAASRGLPLIDLRVIFSEPADYANAIEPSAEGGRKFAAAITAVATGHDFAGGRSTIFVRA
jgi:lysophospholipase L1-like esterase